MAAAVYLAARITEAVEQVVLKAAEAMRWLQEAATLAAADGVPMRWTTPDGFPVVQAYPDTKARRVRTTIAGQSMSLKIREDQPKVDARLQRQGIAPNFVHSLDACHLRLTVTRAAEEGMRDFALVHDSFGVHAADTPRFFQIIRESMVEMYGAVDVVGPVGVSIAVTPIVPAGFTLVISGSFPGLLQNGDPPVVVASASAWEQPGDETFVVSDVDFWSDTSITAEFRPYNIAAGAIVNDGFSFMIFVP